MSVDCGLPDFSGDNGLISKIVNNNKGVDYRTIINPMYFE
jgi:NAD-dependent SIR2 family protein deacetylase